LCERHIPVIFYQNDEQVKRLPEKSLTNFLLDMKNDLQNRASYLQYLRVSTKFIQACECDSPVHSYCATALIIRSQSIFCEKCREPYRLFIKEEKVCSNRLFKLVAIYIVVLVSSIAVAIAVMILDGYLKANYVKGH
jgi:hypothetical protein